MGSINEHIEAIVPYWAGGPTTVSEYIAGSIAQYRMDFEHVRTKVHDIRSQPEDCTLDVQGFQLVSIPSPSPTTNGVKHDFHDPAYVKSTIYAETQNLVRNATGAAKVHCFSHLVRTQPLSDLQGMRDDKSIPDSQTTGVAVPSPAAHIDQSPRGARELLRDNLDEDEAEELARSGKRWAIVNCWRPIETVRRDPLCLCDARTVDVERDWILVRAHLPKTDKSTFGAVSRGQSFETVAVKSNRAHRWYYCSELSPDEALLLKIHDSAAGEPIPHPTQEGGGAGVGVGVGVGVIAGGVPHTGLNVPGTEDLPARQSIEIRSLVFWD